MTVTVDEFTPPRVRQVFFRFGEVIVEVVVPPRLRHREFGMSVRTAMVSPPIVGW